jgi:hypothetical protein
VINQITEQAEKEREEVRRRLTKLYDELRRIIVTMVHLKRQWAQQITPYTELFGELGKLDQVIREAEDMLRNYDDHEIYDLLGWTYQKASDDERRGA